MSENDLPGTESPGSLVRSFMITGGRTTSSSGVQLPLETMVSRAPGSERFRDGLRFESQKVFDFVETPCSIAEVSAEFQLPLLAAIILVGDLVSQEILTAAEVVEVVDINFLLRIRNAIEAI